jgi:hypothetical protein
MTAKNDITGDKIQSKQDQQEQYEKNYCVIYCKTDCRSPMTCYRKRTPKTLKGDK